MIFRQSVPATKVISSEELRQERRKLMEPEDELSQRTPTIIGVKVLAVQSVHTVFSPKQAGRRSGPLEKLLFAC